MKLLLVFFLLVAFPLSSLAGDYQGNCSVTFQGSSTLHDFNGAGSCQPFVVGEIDGVLKIPAISVPVAGLDTDNARRDKKMRAMFDGENFPLITGIGGPVDLASLANGAGSLALTLQIRGIDRAVTATVDNVVKTDGTITADLAFPVSLANYRLEPPSVLGIISVDDQVNVALNIALTAIE
ncbi:MAG: YceI family protein [Desulfuromonadales bacterium]